MMQRILRYFAARREQQAAMQAVRVGMADFRENKRVYSEVKVNERN